MASVSLTAVEKDLMDEAYRDAEDVINNVVWAVCRKYRVNHEDALSRANEAFLTAYDNYDPDRGPFRQWVGYRVKRGLLHWLETEARRRARLPRQALTEVFAARPVALMLAELEDGLTADARRVVGLVLNPPADLTLALYGQEDGRRGALAALREVLVATGWTHRRVGAAFAEVANAL